MKTKTLAASLLALGLFAASAMAQDSQPRGPDEPAAGEPTQEQAPAVEAPPPQAAVPAEVMALIGDARSPTELSPEELQQRYQTARQFSKMEGIAPDLQEQLAAIAKAARNELRAREQQQQQAQPEAPPPPQPEAAPAQQAQPEPAPAPQPESGQRSASPNDGGAMPPAVAEMLQDGRAAAELDDRQLNRRIDRLNKFMSIDSLPPDATARLRGMLADAEQEAGRRQQSAGQPAPQPAPQPPVAAQPEPPPQPAPAPQPPVAEAPQPAAPPPAPPRPPVAEVPAIQPAPQPVAPPAPAVDRADIKRLDSNKIDERMEEAAVRFLESPGVRGLSDDDLRQRLDEMRSVLATNSLSPTTERLLRQRVNQEREVLRERVAEREAQQLRKQERQTPRRRFWAEEAPADWEWRDRDVLNDRRRSEDLRTYELRRRLEVYRQAVNDRRYGPEYRDYWRAVIARDQYVLQLRLVDLRKKRQAQIDDLYGDEELNFDIGASAAPEDDVYAAEVDDSELQDMLTAKPRRKFQRRYSVEEIEANGQLRAALPRVEVDTVRFGFNEAFVRPEEIDKLDRIGEILERILRKNPREVFLIEGHTDAVGSDAANLALSRKRAEAVKKALTTYYIIPPQALRTVGYGERYLKIPTAEAEPENRRVSVSRATDLIGGLQ